MELEAALQTIEKPGLRGLLPRAHFLLAQALHQAGDAEGAARHTAEAGRVLQEMRKEARTDDLVKRIDLQPIVAATRSASWADGRRATLLDVRPAQNGLWR